MNRAYSLLTVKAVDEDKRIITGIATTPAVDRQDDIVEPKGAQFDLPIPFLWQHDSDRPVGHVTHAKVTNKGIEVQVQLKSTDEPGLVKDRLDSAWQDIKLGLVRGLSIGFKPLESANIDGSFGRRFIKWLWLELSGVTVAANGEATITAIKAIDTEVRAASGRKDFDEDRPTPPAPGKKKSTPVVKAKEAKTMKKTYAEQISAFEATRQAKAAEMDALMEKSMESGETLDADSKEQYDTLETEVKEIDEHLVRLRAAEQRNRKAAVPVGNIDDPAKAADARDPAKSAVRVETKSMTPKGIAFTRFVIAKTLAARDMIPATEIAKARWPDMPELQTMLKAAVDAGSSSNMSALVEPQIAASEFIEYLWPRTIIGRIPGLRRVPFNIKVQRQTAVSSVNWVGEGKPKPVSKGTFDTVTLGYYKIAGIVALTDEVLRFSNPSAEALVRDELSNAIIKLMDKDFLDPEKAAVANVSPASVTNGVTGVSATGTAYANFVADFASAMANFDAAEIDTSDLVVVTRSRQARALGLMLNSLGQPLFPGLGATGGSLLGFPVITSNNVDYTEDSPAEGDNIIFIKPSDIFLADDGGVSIDISREASVQMNDAPDDPASASTVLVSFWQHNLVGIRAERFINWLKRRDAAVQYIKAAKYA